jgi:hypothetical protein
VIKGEVYLPPPAAFVIGQGTSSTGSNKKD